MTKQAHNRLRLDKKGEPYGICPICHAKIYKLIETTIITTYNKQEIFIDKNGAILPGKFYKETQTYEHEYYCPKCKSIVAFNITKAEPIFYEQEVEEEVRE